jgi:hypothetical protein
VARKVQLELWHWNRVHTLYSETVVVVAGYPDYTIETHRAFSRLTLQYARATKKARAPSELYVSFFCYPVAVVPTLDPATATTVREEAPDAQWSSAVMPVVYESDTETITHLEKTPLWRWDYYSVLRRFVEENLVPRGAARTNPEQAVWASDEHRVSAGPGSPEAEAPPLPLAARAPFPPASPLPVADPAAGHPPAAGGRPDTGRRPHAGPTADRNPLRMIVALVIAEFLVLFLGTLFSTGVGFAVAALDPFSTGASPGKALALVVLMAFFAALVALGSGAFALVKVGRPVRSRRAALLFGAVNLMPALGLLIMAGVLAAALHNANESGTAGGVVAAGLALSALAAAAGTLAGALLGERLANRDSMAVPAGPLAR